ncbi:MAG: aromatic ring-hydroxylating dioxygenase subunit alpha [Alphaproteobacteria bacterium]
MMNVESQKGLKPGEARAPGPSTKDIIKLDPNPAPDALVAEHFTYNAREDIAYERYYDPAFFQKEVEQLWSKVWQWACRLEHIPEVGDNYVYDVGPYSILVVRHGEGPEDIKAYHNSCLHRGTQLKPSDSQGHSPKLRCPFHGWEWNLDGTINEIPCRWDFPKIKDEDVQLPEVKVGFWGGFVFINMDPDSISLEEHLEVLPDHFSQFFPLDRRYIEVHLRRELPCNWKAGAEAFIEAYHVRETHNGADPVGNGCTNAQYDVFGDNVTRFVHTIGYPSPNWPNETPEDIANGMEARIKAAQANRETLGEKYEIDLSGYSDSEMLDSIEYFCFPNMFLFPGITLPMIYRFRPNGMDPDSCLFDLLFLRPLKDGEDHPEPPEVVRLGLDEVYATVPNMDPGLAIVYEQDTSNLEAQQRGFKAGLKRVETLANYQESRVRQVHITLDKYVKD